MQSIISQGKKPRDGLTILWIVNTLKNKFIPNSCQGMMKYGKF